MDVLEVWTVEARDEHFSLDVENEARRGWKSVSGRAMRRWSGGDETGVTDKAEIMAVDGRGECERVVSRRARDLLDSVTAQRHSRRRARESRSER